MDSRPEGPQPREGRGATTRERIVVAAAEAFATGGYNGVNLNDVVAGLDLTKGALYYFFPTKDLLALEIVRRHFASLSPLVDEVSAEIHNRLGAVVELTYRIGELLDHPITRAGLRLSIERNLVGSELPRPFVGGIDRITKMLREAKTRHELRATIDPKATSELIVSYLYGAQIVSRELGTRRDLLVRLDDFWALVLPTLQPS